MTKQGIGVRIAVIAVLSVMAAALLFSGCTGKNGGEKTSEPTGQTSTAEPGGNTSEPLPTPSEIVPFEDTYKGDTCEMNKKALELYLGEKDSLELKDVTATVKWETTDPGVAVVDETTGEITAVGCGNCVIRAKGNDIKASARVYVVEKEFSFDDNILISIFWPPTKEYVNDEQYKLLGDAQIDWVMSAGDNLSEEETQLKMLELCYKYGMHMTVAAEGFGSSLQNKSAAEIKRLVEKYRNMPAANGYYILDEPINPNVFLKAYVALKEQDPSAYMHLNFLPYGAYSSVKAYISQMNDWAKLCADAGYPVEYLMYDLYPFGLEAGSLNRTAFLLNLNAARIAGLRNNVKTGNYIQSVEQSVAFRSLNREETLYEMNMSLAFGIKQLSYFTWFTPHDRSEPFDKGIISSKGVPSDKYPFICELNNYVHTIGKTLVRCDALEVYQGKNTQNVIDLVPNDFFVQFKSKADFTLSYLRDKQNGRNYLMLVNNSFQKEKSCSLVFDSSVKGDISVIDEKTGALAVKAKEADGSYAFTLGAGAAAVIALPEGFDYMSGKSWNPSEGENLALHAEVSCNSSAGTGGWYIDNLNDGDRYGKTANGWQSDTKKASVITFAFEKPVEMNRVDVYPFGNLVSYGDSAPETFKVYVSDDGKDFREIEATVNGVEGFEALKKITFEKVTAKYLRLECDSKSHKIKISEIEVYNDNGNVAEPNPHDTALGEARGKTVVRYKANSNIALNRPVTVSSYPAGAEYKSWGWWPEFLVDGTDKGWTSNVKANSSQNSTEYAVIDLGDYFEIDTVKVKPNGCWPKDFQIKVSKDMINWTVIADEKNSKAPDGYYIAENGKTCGRYLMFIATKLRNTSSDGYMLQLGEIEVYGKPHVNYEEAEMLAKRFIDLGGSADNSSYKSVMNEIANAAGSERAKGTLTQSKLDSYFKAMLEKVGTSIEEELIK